MNIGIIGTGYVGIVSGACLADVGNQVTCYDIDKVKILKLQKGIIPIYEIGLEEKIKRCIKSQNLGYSFDLNKICNDNSFLYLTPGISLNKKTDNMDQTFSTPDEAILQKNCDIIIVGRGIYDSSNPEEEAETYKLLAWNAYKHKVITNL